VDRLNAWNVISTGSQLQPASSNEEVSQILPEQLMKTTKPLAWAQPCFSICISLPLFVMPLDPILSSCKDRLKLP
jgi:hypothetical protein